jgi:hypothetical protein
VDDKNLEEHSESYNFGMMNASSAEVALHHMSMNDNAPAQKGHFGYFGIPLRPEKSLFPTRNRDNYKGIPSSLKSLTIYSKRSLLQSPTDTRAVQRCKIPYSQDTAHKIFFVRKFHSAENSFSTLLVEEKPFPTLQ